jgi:hypothetical protein
MAIAAVCWPPVAGMDLYDYMILLVPMRQRQQATTPRRRVTRPHRQWDQDLYCLCPRRVAPDRRRLVCSRED